MARIGNRYVREFCSICDNFSEENLECAVLNKDYRRKYLKNDNCPYASINEISVMVLKKDKIYISGKWYNRRDEKGIESALENKREDNKN